MAKIDYLNYDENVDHLTIYKAKEKIINSTNLGNVILSFNKKKEIVGIEFMGVHEDYEVPLDVLNHLKGCKLKIIYNPDRKYLSIAVLLRYEGKHTSPLSFTSPMDLGKNPVNETIAYSEA